MIANGCRLGSKLEGESSLRHMLNSVFLIACWTESDTSGFSENASAGSAPKAFPSLWISLLHSELALNCPPVIG
jgi:hypothetical protein